MKRGSRPQAVWCPRDAAQGEATNPRDAAELARARIWRVHVEELQTVAVRTRQCCASSQWTDPQVSTRWLAPLKPRRAFV